MFTDWNCEQIALITGYSVRQVYRSSCLIMRPQEKEAAERLPTINEESLRSLRCYKKILRIRERQLTNEEINDIERWNANRVPKPLIAIRLGINLRSVFRVVYGDEYIHTFHAKKGGQRFFDFTEEPGAN